MTHLTNLPYSVRYVFLSNATSFIKVLIFDTLRHEHWNQLYEITQDGNMNMLALCDFVENFVEDFIAKEAAGFHTLNPYA